MGLFDFLKKKTQAGGTISADVLPTYYESFAKDIVKSKALGGGYRFQLCAQDGSDDFKILFYGNLMGKHLIAATEDAFSKVIAKALSSGEEILVFDGMVHGYNNLACYEHSEAIERPLKESDFGQGKIFIEIESLPDDESDWELDEDRNVIINEDKKIPWQEFKRNAICWLQVYFVTKDGHKKEIIDEELS